MAVLLLVGGADSSLSGYTRDHAKRLKSRYLKYGIDAFKDKRKNNRDRILSVSEKQQVVAILKTKKPKDVISGCTVEHWTTGLLGVYILERFGKRYKSKTSEHLLFRAASFSWHCPGRSYENADDQAKVLRIYP